jgi:hypothetical protein
MTSKQSGIVVRESGAGLWEMWNGFTEKNSKGENLINSSKRTVEARKRQLSGTVRQKSQRLGYKEWWDRLGLKTYQ